MVELLRKGGTRGGEKSLASITSPLVSIVVVTLNAEEHIEDCLRSIVNQACQNLEVIVFDGGSQDRTIEILKKYDSTISYWQSEPDKGIYDAMNKAVDLARGQWFYFLGADDRLLPGFSELAYKLVAPNTVYYGDMSYNGQPRNIPHTGWPRKRFAIRQSFIHEPFSIIINMTSNILWLRTGPSI